ncbi:MAG: hypothetical protein HFJ86_05010 [Oscillospiraceae bacterium]|jgi:hypothetical protein|nr:hypothetical protein [Oscillospiraceae bacterium]
MQSFWQDAGVGREMRHAASLPFSRRELLAKAGFGALCLAVGVAVLVGLLALERAVAWWGLDDDIAPLLADERFAVPLAVETEPVIPETSGEYAIIAALGQALGYPVTEEGLLEENGGRISCGGPEGFADQLEQSLPGMAAKGFRELKNTEFLLACREQLSRGVPVPFDYLEEGALAPQTGLIVALDLQADNIRLLTPAGEYRDFSVHELLAATRLEGSFSFPLWVGKLTGSFSPNTLYRLSPRE